MIANIERRVTRVVDVGGVKVGGGNPIAVQSMTKTKTADWEATALQIREFEEAGCEIVRCAANTIEAAEAIKKIKPQISIPLAADVHFDHKIALAAIKSGADKIRINPGNIGSREKVKEVVLACKDHGVPIRIGVNAGSLEKELLKEFGYPGAEAMVESAMRHVAILEEHDFDDIIISVKSSHVYATIEATRLLSAKTDYPLHLGVTEAGGSMAGLVKSSVGIGALLAEGIGDTIRVSLTGSGVDEVRAGKEILRSLGYPGAGINIISCPTCGRLESDLVSMVREVSEGTQKVKAPLNVAIMGCVVNGPGESRGADIGVSVGKDHAVLYIKGESKGMIAVADVAKRVLQEIEKMAEN